VETVDRLKGALATVRRDGQVLGRWQHELPGGARIWFVIEGQVADLVDIHTRHPDRTKR
jgi:hypothetical protein